MRPAETTGEGLSGRADAQRNCARDANQPPLSFGSPERKPLVDQIGRASYPWLKARVEVMRASDAILRDLRAWLSEARLPEDGRLPPERALAARFGVKRAELRKALAVI